MNKIFVIDTSVLLHHEDSIHAFPERKLVVPMIVLEELDTFKTRKDSVGNASRYVNRFLDDLRKEGSFKDGILLENGQEIFVETEYIVPENLDKNKNDNKILGTCILLKQKYERVILLTRDISLRVKADVFGIESENYIKDRARVDRKNAYTGVTVMNVASTEINSFYKNGYLSGDFELFENEFVVLKSSEKSSALGRFYDGKINKLQYVESESIGTVEPRNKEQRFALDVLNDPDISMVTITGKAGCGKTILSVASAVGQLIEGNYKKIIITRPNISMSKDIGFLPGSKEEKMRSWVQPIFDNLKIAFSKYGVGYVNAAIEKGDVEIESLSYIRGRSLPNTIFIIDEAQNITYHEAKAVLTRMGENSKIILLGDVEQIDAPHLDATSSGLSSIVEMFKEFDESAHITLLKGERSRLASYAAKIL
jgi:PhoH-like ATPase